MVKKSRVPSSERLQTVATAVILEEVMTLPIWHSTATAV